MNDSVARDALVSPSRSGSQRAVSLLLAAASSFSSSRRERSTCSPRRKRVSAALAELGVVQALAGGRHALADGGTAAPSGCEAAIAVVTRLAERRDAVRARLGFVRSYAETSGCRRAFLLRYFGEAAAERCGRCDNCESDLQINRLVYELYELSEEEIAFVES
ncbi:RecQ family zinc-binding domain-containing protein [Helicobacter sp. faydin-H76]|uniref:RecQ family zinc-binding domain-containing protein n=1 Tax=Helicobacter cappadocius TaxID=3063998 RepID=A0AA90TAD6_9HELI|nr:RecQ family zinc-binding domain-containing protein [Helicobacter sp. faydin-H76]MDP2539842.1 RecQ family zinc-binding domain-containing protein [Helicobacter sp. faydin-H76]